ncbi:MAG TPA: hypothetical protein VFM10_08590, partial [Terriglobales bacterium]|nr:hypothetical protein [Terriglobales bacterium]
MKIPARIPILSLILGVLLLVSVVPMYFYATRVVAINRDRLKRNEMLLQNTITRSLGEDIAQREKNFRIMLGNFCAGVQAASGGSLEGDRVGSEQLRSLLESYVNSSADVAYATLVNSES